MNTQKKNIILVLVVGLILSVNYGAYAESVAAEEQLIGTDEKTKELIKLHGEEIEEVEESVDADESEVNEETEEIEESEETEETEEIEESEETEETAQTEEAEAIDKTAEAEVLDELEETDNKNSNDSPLEDEDGNTNDVNTSNVSGQVVQEVTDWKSFQKAYENEDTKKIILLNNLDGPSSRDTNGFNKRNTSIEIDGNNKTINTAKKNELRVNLFPLESNGNNNQFILKNISISHTNNDIIFVDGSETQSWSIYSENVTLQETGSQNTYIRGESIREIEITGTLSATLASDFIAAKNSNVIVGNARLDISTSGVGINSEKVKIHDSVVKIRTESDGLVSANVEMSEVSGLIISGTSVIKAEERNKKVIVKFNNSRMDLESTDTGRSAVLNLGYISNQFPVHLEISGERTVLNLKSVSTRNKYGAIRIKAVNNDDKYPSGVYINKGAKVNIDVSDQHGIYSRIENKGQTVVDGVGTELNVVQIRGSGYYAAALRYAYVGNQTFQVSNGAKVNVEAGIGNTPAVRMYGNDNKFMILTGAQIKIHNPGDGINKRPGLNGSNQGIQYQYSSENMFLINGSGSSMEIISDHGPAIDGDGLMNIDVGEDTVFVVEGKTRSENEAIFHSDTMNFISDGPRYYDFSNKRDGGGQVLVGSNKDSRYTSHNSDFAVWKVGSNLDGNPVKSWSKFDFELGNRNLSEIITTSHPKEFNNSEDSFGDVGMMAYTRISGNNARPVIDEMPIPFDTDRYVYGHISVPEGLDGLRNAWTDEVHVTLEQRDEQGNLLKVYRDIPTRGMEDGNTGYPVYDVEESERGGYFRVDLGEGNLATIDHEFRVVSAYRGNTDYEEDRKVYSDQNKLPQEVVVIDKTPPPIADIESPIYNKQNIIKGTSKEKEVTVSLVLDGEVLKDKNNEPVSKKIENGKWEFNLSDIVELEANQILHVVLEDSSGNKNPLEDIEFHDIIKHEASHVKIKESLFTLDAKDLYISLEDFDHIKNHKGLIKAMTAKAIEERETIVEHEVIIVDDDNLDFENTKDGTYIINFAIKDFESITLQKQLHIMPYDQVIEGEQYVIVANDFYASRLDYKKEDQEIVKLANAKAFNKQDMTQDVGVLLSKNTLRPEEGIYPLEFKVLVDHQTMVEVKATVLDYDHVEETKEYLLVANDFSIMDYLAADIADSTIINKSSATAWRLKDWKEMPVQVVSHNVKPIADDYAAILRVNKNDN